MHAAQQSFVDGWQQAMWVGAAVMGVMFLLVIAPGPKSAAPAGGAGTDADARGDTAVAAEEEAGVETATAG